MHIWNDQCGFPWNRYHLSNIRSSITASWVSGRGIVTPRLCTWTLKPEGLSFHPSRASSKHVSSNTLSNLYGLIFLICKRRVINDSNISSLLWELNEVTFVTCFGQSEAHSTHWNNISYEIFLEANVGVWEWLCAILHVYKTPCVFTNPFVGKHTATPLLGMRFLATLGLSR